MTPQELKESILWNVIQGKFTTQDPRESVSDVLGKTQITPVAEEDAYFEIPDNWCWARIGEIFDLVNGKAFKPTDWSESGIPIVRIQNLNDPNAPYNCFSGEIEEKYILHGGELLFSWSGTPGTSFGAFIWNGGHAVLNQHIFIVYPKIKLDYEYAKYALNGELRIFIAKAHGGAGLKHITRKEFDSCFLPIPPLAEQKRIVAKIEELLPLIERYEKAWSRLENFNKRFPGDMQKSILQMAIQGKLVEQRPEEGTGEELYKQIQAEKQALVKAGKIKRDKRTESEESPSENEIPFDIPETWKWTYLGCILNKLTDGTHKTPKYASSGVKFVSVKDMSSGNLSLENTKYISVAEHEELYTRCDPVRGDMLLSKVGTTGVPAIVNTDEPFSLFVSVALLKYSHSCIDEHFLYYLLLSPLVQMQATENTRGVGNKNWVLDAIAKTVIVLPPLAEQKRIVAKLEELLPLCERLK